MLSYAFQVRGNGRLRLCENSLALTFTFFAYFQSTKRTRHVIECFIYLRHLHIKSRIWSFNEESLSSVELLCLSTPLLKFNDIYPATIDVATK